MWQPREGDIVVHTQAQEYVAVVVKQSSELEGLLIIRFLGKQPPINSDTDLDVYRSNRT